MSTTTRSAPVQPPLQARSRRSYERMLDATEELLEDRPFEAIRISEIVGLAGTSVGAFYARFRDKDALLPALYQRYDAWMAKRAAAAAKKRPRLENDLEQTIQWLVHELVELFCHRRYLNRAVAIHARLRPDKIDLETRERRVRQMAYLREALLSCRSQITASDPERAVDFAIFSAAAVCRELLLFRHAPHAASLDSNQAELEVQLARQVQGYLCLDSIRLSERMP